MPTTKRQKGLIVMYKDDNTIGGCNDALLRMMIEGRGNTCPSCESGGCNTPAEGRKTWGLSGEYPLASVYAPLQEFDELYDLDTALKQGTVFAKLDLPFKGDMRVSKGGGCRG